MMTTPIDKVEGPDLKARCLFCYKNLRSKSVGVEFQHSLEEEVERFFKLLCRHFAAGPDGRNLEAMIRTLLKGGGGGLGLCEDCREVAHSFCEAYHRMKVAELEVDAKLWTVTNVMTNADRGNTSVKVEEEQECSKVLGRMRTSLVRKCCSMSRHSFPRPLLRRCEGSPENEGDHAYSEFTSEELRRVEENQVDTSKNLFREPPYKLSRLDLRTDKPFQCRYCDDSFRNLSNRGAHEFRAHPEHLLSNYRRGTTSLIDFETALQQLFRRLIVQIQKSCYACQCCGKNFTRRVEGASHIIQQHHDLFSQDISSIQAKLTRPLNLKSKSSPSDGSSSAEESMEVESSSEDCEDVIIPLDDTRIHAEKKQYKCAHCPIHFKVRKFVTQHEYRCHRPKILASAKESCLSEEQFDQSINAVLARFIVGKKKCALCNREDLTRIQLEQHIMVNHSKRFGEELKRHQQNLLEAPPELLEFLTGKRRPNRCTKGTKAYQKQLPLTSSLLTDVLQGENELEDSLETNSVPLLVVHGSPQPVSPPEFAQRPDHNNANLGEVEPVIPLEGGVSPPKVEVRPTNPLKSRTSNRCGICNQVVSHPANLARHMNAHFGNQSSNYKCAYCPFRFMKPHSVTQHELRYHRSKHFGSVKEPGLSDDQFARTINAVLDRFIDGKVCTLCNSHNLKRSTREQHVMVDHAQRFCKELTSAQRKFIQENPRLLFRNKNHPARRQGDTEFHIECPQDSEAIISEPFSIGIDLSPSSAPLEFVQSSNHSASLEKEESFPIPIFIPKAESSLDEGGSMPTQEGDLSILGI